MHQQCPARKPSHAHKCHVTMRVIWLLRLLFVVFASLLLRSIAGAVLLLGVAGAAVVLLLGWLEGSLAGLLVEVDVAVLTAVPFGDPGGWNLRGASRVSTVGGLLRWIFLLALVAFGVGELVDEVVEEGHLRGLAGVVV